MTFRKRGIGMRSYRQLTAESLETRQLLAAVDFTAHDQLMLELVNRARMAPLEEAQRYGIDLNEGFDEGTISSEPTQPLAPNQILTDAARAHSADMLAREFFAHENPDGLGPADRARALGYPGTAGENLAWYGTDGGLSRDAEVYNRHEALFLSKEHRKNMLVAGYRELGVGIDYGFLRFERRNSVVVTENFGNPGGNYFITGIAYDDLVEKDSFYTIGEGLGSITITAVRNLDGATFTTVTGNAGGYGMQVPSGVYTVTATGAQIEDEFKIEEVAVLNSNQKVDFNTRMSGLSAISGLVYHDFDGDSLISEGDLPLPDFPVFIDVDQNSQWNPDETRKLTDVDGDYIFPNLRAGTYRFAVDLPDGWIVTAPENNLHEITVPRGQLRLNVFFGVQQINEIPVAGDDQFTIEGDAATQIDVFANDSDDGALVYEDTRILTQPSHGSVSLDVATNQLVYRADEGFSGQDFFEYRVADDEGLFSETARVDLEVLPGPGTQWQNPEDPNDVNGDTHVSSIDVLLILNDLNANTARRLPTPENGNEPPPFVDVNGDGFVSPIDALLVLNDLNLLAFQQRQQAEGEPPEQASLDASMSASASDPASAATQVFASDAMTAAAIEIAFAEDLDQKKRRN